MLIFKTSGPFSFEILAQHNLSPPYFSELTFVPDKDKLNKPSNTYLFIYFKTLVRRTVVLSWLQLGRIPILFNKDIYMFDFCR